MHFRRVVTAGFLVLAVPLAGCSSGHKAATAPTPSPTSASPSPSASPSATAAASVSQAFGMHVLGLGGHPYPALPFGSARIWDMGVTWKDLQPTASTPLTGSSNPALTRLDGIVSTFRQHHVEPLLTLGMTPDWAAQSCKHVSYGQDWGSQTCAPKATGAGSPWANYVKAIATRYAGSVKYFETWNEPSLANGWNSGIAPMAQLQKTAHDVLASLGHGQKLVSPGIPFTNGPPTNGLSWLSQFLAQPGGTAFDIVGLHLYPADKEARAGTGPEWAAYDVLPQIRSVLSQHGVGSKPVWNTETNVGRLVAKTGYRDTLKGAGAVARTYVLALENGVARTFWYAADDRAWGGTWLMNASNSGLSIAGTGYATVFRMVKGLAPMGCSHPSTTAARGVYSCRFGDGSGAVRLVAVWTTGSPTTVAAPKAAAAAYSVVGAKRSVSAGAKVQVTGLPTYITVG